MANEIELTKVCKAHSNDVRPGRFPFTSRRYRQLAAEGIFPPVVKGKIDFVAAAFAVASYFQKMAESSGSLVLTDERAGNEAIKKEINKLRLEQLKGKLVERDWAKGMIGLLVSEARTAMLGLPKRLAGMLAAQTDPKEIETMLSEDVREILTNLSGNGAKKKGKT